MVFDGSYAAGRRPVLHPLLDLNAPMTALDLLWHLAGFVALPLLFGFLAAASVRLLWRRRWGTRRFWPIAGLSGLLAVGVAGAGLLLTGRDGSMTTYAAMVLACSVLLTWTLRRT